MFFNVIFSSSLARFGLIAVILSLGIFIGVQLTGRVEAAPTQLTTQEPIQQGSTTSSASPETIHAQHLCTIADVMVDVVRIHVRCTVANTDGMQFFAVSTADTKHTARVLALLLTAQATGKTIDIFYNQNDTSGSTFGCLEVNCRLILFVKMLN